MCDLLLRIRFDSDWHIGAGAGRGGAVDRVVRRHPEDGLPYVPAKSLTGIWRDACEQVAAGLDEGGDGNWSQWVKTLFGGTDYDPQRETELVARPRHRPRPALLSVRAARFPEPLRSELCRQPALGEMLAFIKPGVRLDEYGVAIEEHLRMEEVICAGAILEARGELALPQDQGRDTALALLWAGARMVERIGGKRRRGYGRCRLEIVTGGLTDRDRIKQLLDTPIPPMPPTAKPSLALQFRSQPQSTDGVAAGSPAEPWHRIVLDIELLAPVVAFNRYVGNVVETRDYIPGTYLLAALTPKLSKLLDEALFPAAAAGKVRFLNAYPIVDGQRGLPVPLSLHYLKEAEGSDKVQTVFNRFKAQQQEKRQQKQLRSGYVAAAEGGGAAVLQKLDVQAVTHGTIDDEVQRPSTRVGGVFTFEAIPSGSRLRTELWIGTDILPTLDQAVISSLAGRCRLGKAKKDDYGLARINASLARVEQANPGTGSLVVWLTSLVLLRDDNLRPTADPAVLQQALEKRLGVTLDLDIAFQRSDRGEGWHSGWGQPRPSLAGIAAGSCFRFGVTGELQPEKLAELEWQGLGERRAEGFGELVLNPPLLARDEIIVKVAKAEPPVLAGTGEVEQIWSPQLTQFAHQLVYRAWRSALVNRALAKAAEAQFRTDILGWKSREYKPTNSQLGALRALLEALKDEASRKLLEQWIEHLKQTPKRRDQWPNRAIEVIEGMAHAPELAWDHLVAEDPLPRKLPELSDLKFTELRKSLRFEAMRALWLAAVQRELRYREQLQRAAKQAQGA